jgi:hypothetical protein
MHALTFDIPIESPCDDDRQLAPCSPSCISDAMWEELAAQIARQRTQIPTPAAILARRCLEGYAAAAVSGGRIAAYTSLSPVAEIGSLAHGWASLAVPLGIPEAALPTADVYEFASSWTDPAWRCKHINMTFRLLLTRRFLHPPDGGRRKALALGGMIGLTSSALARLGCRVLAWDAAPFVTSLIAAPRVQFPLEAAAGWRPPEGLSLYQGPEVLLDDPLHRWEQYIHCWVSDIDLALALDGELSTLMKSNLRRWRSAIVARFGCPDSLHRLAFLPWGD